MRKQVQLDAIGGLGKPSAPNVVLEVKTKQKTKFALLTAIYDNAPELQINFYKTYTKKNI